MDKTVLTICPSRGRPDVITDMVQSWLATRSEGNELLVYLNDDDPKLHLYRVPDLPEIHLVIGPRKHLAEVYNAVSETMAFDYYAPVNDDHYFVTPQWDEKLIRILEDKGHGWGIAMADDKLTDWSQCLHPSGCIVSGKMVRLLGYMVYPKIQHIGIDTMLMRLCQGINCLFPTKDVVIEHRHWSTGHRPIDANYKWVYSTAQQEYGNAAYRDYIFHHYANDVAKIKAAMEREIKEEFPC